MFKIFDLNNKKVFVVGYKGLVGKVFIKVFFMLDVEIIIVDKEFFDLWS